MSEKIYFTESVKNEISTLYRQKRIMLFDTFRNIKVNFIFLNLTFQDFFKHKRHVKINRFEGYATIIQQIAP